MRKSPALIGGQSGEAGPGGELDWVSESRVGTSPRSVSAPRWGRWSWSPGRAGEDSVVMGGRGGGSGSEGPARSVPGRPLHLCPPGLWAGENVLLGTRWVNAVPCLTPPVASAERSASGCCRRTTGSTCAWRAGTRAEQRPPAPRCWPPAPPPRSPWCRWTSPTCAPCCGPPGSSGTGGPPAAGFPCAWATRQLSKSERAGVPGRGGRG